MKLPFLTFPGPRQRNKLIPHLPRCYVVSYSNTAEIINCLHRQAIWKAIWGWAEQCGWLRSWFDEFNLPT